MIKEERLDQIIARFKFLEAKLNSAPDLNELRALGQEYSELRPIVMQIESFRNMQLSLQEAKELLADPEMKSLAIEEISGIEKKIIIEEQALLLSLIPKDKADKKSVILEIRAGTGGDEASLFAMDLARMYQKLSELKGWKFEILEKSLTEIGGIRELVANISGD